MLGLVWGGIRGPVSAERVFSGNTFPGRGRVVLGECEHRNIVDVAYQSLYVMKLSVFFLIRYIWIRRDGHLRRVLR